MSGAALADQVLASIRRSSGDGPGAKGWQEPRGNRAGEAAPLAALARHIAPRPLAETRMSLGGAAELVKITQADGTSYCMRRLPDHLQSNVTANVAMPTTCGGL